MRTLAQNSSRLSGSPVGDNRSDPCGSRLHRGMATPDNAQARPSATSQRHGAAREATASRTQQSDLFSLVVERSAHRCGAVGRHRTPWTWCVKNGLGTAAFRRGGSDIAGWRSLAAQRTHNPTVGGSNPSPATARDVRAQQDAACCLNQTAGERPARVLSTLDAAPTAIRKADRSPKSGDGATRRLAWRSLVARWAETPEVARSNRAASPHRNQSVRSAQQRESATRLASVALSVTGSAAA